MVGGAALIVGGLIGFLFGVPRSAGSNSENNAEFQPNTNLEQISDWLTKVLVGVGLTQIATLPDQMGRLGAFLSPALGNSEGGVAFGVATTLYFSACGFFVAYIWARAVGPTVFADQRLQQLMTTSLDTADIQDEHALRLVDDQLSLAPGSTPASQRELTEAVVAASRSTREEIFTRAREHREAMWRERVDRMELCIPILEALVVADPDREFHQNRGQLGFALKDQVPPNYKRAEQQLTDAIAIRGDSSRGWLWYEFNRALCRASLSRPTEEVLNDLKTAARDPHLKEIILQDHGDAGWKYGPDRADGRNVVRAWADGKNIDLSVELA